MRRVRAASTVSFLHGSGAGSNFRRNLFMSARSSKEMKAILQDEQIETACDPSIIAPACTRRDSLHAHNLFDGMSNQHTVPEISALCFHLRGDDESKALVHLSRLRRCGLKPKEEILSSFVGICSREDRISHGMVFHCIILKQGFHDHHTIARNLVVMYSKCGKMDSARQFLNETTACSSILWNSMISGYLHNNMANEAINLFPLILGMSPDRLILVDNFTLSSIFKACALSGSIRIGKIMHGLALKLSFKWDVVVTGSLMDMYSMHGCLGKARRIFEDQRERDLVAWNAIISAYVRFSHGNEAVKLCQRMQFEGFSPNETTLASILKASSEIQDVDLGRCLHSYGIKRGYLSDSFVGTALVAMYSKCMQIEAAESVFMAMEGKNLVSYNALLSGYSLVCGHKKAMETFILLLNEEMKPDPLTLTGLLSTCSSNAMVEGFQVHCHAIKLGIHSHVSVGNSLVGFYAKCGIIDSSLKAFGSISEPNSISWAGIISSLVKNDEGEQAMRFFKTMLLSGEMPDEFSASAVLKVSSDWSAVESGKHFHTLTIKLGIEYAVFVATGLVDMYCKSGMVDDALKLFDSMPLRNDATWNAIINGLGHNGRYTSSLEVFHKMVGLGIMPNALTFNAVLSACCHAGMVNEGRFYFNLMCSWYGISPSIEHYTCMISLLVRSGFLHEAKLLMKACSFMPDPVMERSIFGSYQVCRSECRHLMSIVCSSNYVILSNLFAKEGFWTEVAEIRGSMREMGMNKEPGYSWIVIKDETHVFSAGQKLWFPDPMKTMLFLVHWEIIARS